MWEVKAINNVIQVHPNFLVFSINLTVLERLAQCVERDARDDPSGLQPIRIISLLDICLPNIDALVDVPWLHPHYLILLKAEIWMYTSDQTIGMVCLAGWISWATPGWGAFSEE